MLERIGKSLSEAVNKSFEVVKNIFVDQFVGAMTQLRESFNVFGSNAEKASKGMSGLKGNGEGAAKQFANMKNEKAV